MKIRILIILAALAVVLTSAACRIGGVFDTVRGSGNVVSEERQVSGFDSVSVEAGMQLFLTQGDRESLTIQAEDNIIPHIESQVTGQRLVVRFDPSGPRSFSTRRVVEVHVTLVDVRELEASGGGRIEAGELVSDALSLTASGGSNVRIGSLAASEFSAALSGGSNAAIEGEVGQQTVSMSGGGSYQAGDLLSSRAVITFSGGANGTVWATDSLNANLSGGSNLAYYGRPEVSDRVTGGGGLQSRGEK